MHLLTCSRPLGFDVTDKAGTVVQCQSITDKEHLVSSKNKKVTLMLMPKFGNPKANGAQYAKALCYPTPKQKEEREKREGTSIQ